MTTFLLHTLGSSGDLNPFIALAYELQAAGHTAHFAISPRNAEKVRQMGFAASAIGPDPDWNTDLFRRLLATSAVGPIDILFREMLIPSIVPAWESLMDLMQSADVLVSHSIQLAAPAVSFHTGKPWITAIPATSCFPTALCAPPGVAWHNCPASISTAAWAVASRLFRPLDRLANIEYRKIDAPPRSDVVIGGAYSRHLTVGMWSPAYYPRPADWPAWLQVGGYGRWDAPPEATGTAVSLPEGDGPLVVFTLGSSVVNYPGKFYKSAVDALLPTNWRGLLVGAPADLAIPAHAQQRIQTVTYARYSDVFGHADAIVHQGGVGTTQAACYYGVPAVVVPRGFDQFENAAHIQRNSLGLRLLPHDLSAHLLRRRLARLLGSETIRSAVRDLGAVMRAEPGAVANADLMIALAQRSGSLGSSAGLDSRVEVEV